VLEGGTRKELEHSHSKMKLEYDQYFSEWTAGDGRWSSIRFDLNLNLLHVRLGMACHRVQLKSWAFGAVSS